jgi:hypothetical protein
MERCFRECYANDLRTITYSGMLGHHRDLTTIPRRRAAEFLDPCPMPSTSAILAGSGIPGVIVIAVRLRVRRDAARVAPESLLQDLHNLEVGYVVFIVNACAGA